MIKAFVIAVENLFGCKLMAFNVVNTMNAFHCVQHYVNFCSAQRVHSALQYKKSLFWHLQLCKQSIY